jgi:hypothetical protein
MMRFGRVGMILCGLVLLSQLATAQIVVNDVKREGEEKGSLIVLPYAFSSETYDTSVGVFGVLSRWPEEQSALFATAFGSANGSWRVWFGGYDLRVPGCERLFVNPTIMGSDYRNLKAYVDGNPEHTDVRSGSHDSDPEDYVRNSGWDGSLSFNFRYVLPWGHGKENLINRVKVDSGMLVSDPVGAKSWNPFRSGRTYLFVEPFFRNQELELDDGDRRLRSNGIKCELRHDNTDFVLNPSDGSMKSVAVTRDWGWAESSGDWTHLEVEYRRFIGLGGSKRYRQRVIALDAWYSDVPTWETEEVDGSVRVSSSAPYFEGSTLGGFYRMRAFPVSRYNDRSAIYYSAEYRAIPRWNPFAGRTIWGSPEVEWWQWVLFCEMGRVHDEFDLSELHSDMNVDVGMGVRFYSRGLVGRLDVAVAEESMSLVAMVGQSF